MSKRCTICKTPDFEVDLFEGVYDNEMVMICESCAKDYSVPLIKKPTVEQLKRADKRYSVRERMERMSGLNKETTELSPEQRVVQGNLNRLRMPEPKQTNPDVVDNYYWLLNISRRRKKMTINQLANQIEIPVEIIEAIEKGKIPKDYEILFPKLEGFFDIKLLKYHKHKVNYIRTKEEEEEVIKKVKQKIIHTEERDGEEYKDLDNLRKTKEKRMRDIQEGNFDFSKRKNIDDITLNDLMEMKKNKEKAKKRQKIQEDTAEMFGESLELDD